MLPDASASATGSGSARQRRRHRHRPRRSSGPDLPVAGGGVRVCALEHGRERVVGLDAERGDRPVAERREHQDGEQPDERDAPRAMTDREAGATRDQPRVEDREGVVAEHDDVEGDDHNKDLGPEHEPDERLGSASTVPMPKPTRAVSTTRAGVAMRTPRRRAPAAYCPSPGNSNDRDPPSPASAGPCASRQRSLTPLRRPDGPPNTRCGPLSLREEFFDGRKWSPGESRSDRRSGQGFPTPPPPSIPPEGRRAAGLGPCVGGPFDGLP